MPIIKKYALEEYFTSYDIINDNDVAKLDAFKLSSSYVPILIINCQAYVGALGEKEYDQLFLKFKHGQKIIKN